MKLERLKASLGRWLGKNSARKRQLQSIIGQLSDAAIVVRPGRTFLRSLIETAKIPKKQEHLVRLNGECKADLHWWDTFLEGWNGVALFPGCPQVTQLLPMPLDPGVVVPSGKGGPPGSSFSGHWAGKE